MTRAVPLLGQGGPTMITAGGCPDGGFSVPRSKHAELIRSLLDCTLVGSFISTKRLFVMEILIYAKNCTPPEPWQPVIQLFALQNVRFVSQFVCGRISVPYTEFANNRSNVVSQAQFSQQSSANELLARIGKCPFDWQAIGMTVQILPEQDGLVPPEIGAVDSLI